MAEGKTGTIGTRAQMYRVEFEDDGSVRHVILAENEDDPREIIARQFPDGVVPTKAGVSNSMKLNMGNYESAEVSCWVSLPCLPEELPSTFEVAWSIARAELRAQLSRLRATRNSKG